MKAAGPFPKSLAKWVARKTLGVFVGEREVTVSRVAVTPFGATELESHSEPYEPGQLADTMARLIRPFLPRRGASRVRVGLGLPAMRVFFAARPIQSTDREATPAVLLHEIFRSTDVNVQEMQVDLVRIQPAKKPLASLIACQRKYISELIDALKGCKLRPFRAEPAPLALLRLGSLTYRGPKKANTVIRAFLGEKRAVLLLQHNVALSWRTFELPPGGETSALLSTVMTLQLMGRPVSETDHCDALLIHGRPDLAATLGDEGFRGVVGTPVELFPGPAYDSRSIALGLAMGCHEDDALHDLSRTLKSRPPLREVLPFAQVIAQAAVLSGLSLMLDNHAREVRQAHRTVKSDCAAHAWMAKVDDAKLESEKKELETKVAAVHDYLQTRILWTAMTRDAATRMTESMVLRSFTGVCPFTADAKGKAANKSLVLNLTAPIPQGQAMPREIDRYLDALRADEMLRRDFPTVELVGLRWGAGAAKGGGAAQASFTVNCMPLKDKPTAPAPAPAAKKAK